MNLRCTVGVLLYAALSTAPLCAQTVLDGVYSNAQAQRGARTYANICSHCHEGGEPDADPLFGPEFIDRWREAPLSFLHGFFSKNMPAKDPGSLTPAAYLDTLAFLLRENGYLAGSELKAEMLDTTLLVGAAGPQPLPPSALVKVSGCLRVDGDVARLEQASTFARVRRADEATSEELAESAAQAAGTNEVALRNAAEFDAAALAGKHVLAKGVLNTQGTVSTVSVLSLAGTGGGC
jgi:hypothetical protein